MSLVKLNTAKLKELKNTVKFTERWIIDNGSDYFFYDGKDTGWVKNDIQSAFSAMTKIANISNAKCNLIKEIKFEDSNDTYHQELILSFNPKSI